MLDLTDSFPKSRKRAKNKSAAASTPTQKVNINIILSMGSDRGILEATAYHNAQKVGVAKIEYGSANNRRGGRSGGML